MKTMPLFPLLLAVIVGSTGCASLMPADDQPPAATQAEVAYLRSEIHRLQARLDASDAELGRVLSDVNSGRSSQAAYVTADQLQAVKAQLDSLQSQLRAVDAARAQDKKDIYDDITKKVAALMAQRAASAPSQAASRSGRQTGIEHVVQPGESLSKIAAAYKVSMKVIMQENNLTNAEVIRVGQKLFIPD